jgi:hypothetical protein
MTCCNKFGLPSYDLLVGTPGKLYWVLTCVAYLLVSKFRYEML